MVFRDSSSNYFDCVHWLGATLAPFSCLKWPIKKKGRFHGRRTVYFLCVFVLGQFKEEMVNEWLGFFSYLRRNLIEKYANA